jgi:hypothetical protein
MTKNEVDIIKNSVIDATEAYVEARLAVLDFVKTQIGVCVGTPIFKNKKYYHTVSCNATQSLPNGITYNNVLSVGNIEFPDGSVVFLAAPNAQFSNQFILGKLDDTPCNIVGGSINIGNGAFTVSSNGRVHCGNIHATGGKIAGFNIGNYELTVNDTKISPTTIGCGEAGNGIINLHAGTGVDDTYLQISTAGDPNSCKDGIRIFYNGTVQRIDDNFNVVWTKNFSAIP